MIKKKNKFYKVIKIF